MTERPDKDALTTAAKELNRGIDTWRNRSNWPRDFHNAEYKRWSQELPHDGFAKDNFDELLSVLKAWKALRPISGTVIRTRYEGLIPQLNSAWNSSIAPIVSSDISAVKWEQVQPFVAVAQLIKPTAKPSAVFTSKFCHFLVPQIFPVVDGEVLGLGKVPYEISYQKVQEIWRGTPVRIRTELKRILRNEILASDEKVKVFGHYPWANKIVELRLIGRRS